MCPSAVSSTFSDGIHTHIHTCIHTGIFAFILIAYFGISRIRRSAKTAPLPGKEDAESSLKENLDKILVMDGEDRQIDKQGRQTDKKHSKQETSSMAVVHAEDRQTGNKDRQTSNRVTDGKRGQVPVPAKSEKSREKAEYGAGRGSARGEGGIDAHAKRAYAGRSEQSESESGGNKDGPARHPQMYAGGATNKHGHGHGVGVAEVDAGWGRDRGRGRGGGPPPSVHDTSPGNNGGKKTDVLFLTEQTGARGGDMATRYVGANPDPNWREIRAGKINSFLTTDRGKKEDAKSVRGGGGTGVLR